LKLSCSGHAQREEPGVYGSLSHRILYVQGMAYIHGSEVAVHGKLRSCNCLIDGRFVLKISDFGLKTLTTPSEIIKDQIYYNSK